MIVANWVPHVIGSSAIDSLHLIPYDPAAASSVLAWPLWAFVAILMFSFLGQGAHSRPPEQRPRRPAGCHRYPGCRVRNAFTRATGSRVLPRHRSERRDADGR